MVKSDWLKRGTWILPLSHAQGVVVKVHATLIIHHLVELGFPLDHILFWWR